MKIYIGSDHAGYEFKEKLKVYLAQLGYEVVDKGAFEFDPADDYPDFVLPVAEAVAKDSKSKGIIFGKSGQGEAICANRVQGIKAIVFYGELKENADTFEIIKLGRVHNDANILSLGAGFLSLDQAKFAVELFLTTEFPGEERHIRRIKKLDAE